MSKSVYYQDGRLVLREVSAYKKPSAPFRLIKERWRCEGYHYRAVLPYLQEQAVQESVPRWQLLNLPLQIVSLSALKPGSGGGTEAAAEHMRSPCSTCSLVQRGKPLAWCSAEQGWQQNRVKARSCCSEHTTLYSNTGDFQRDRRVCGEQWVKQSSHRRTPVNRGEQALPHPVCATHIGFSRCSDCSEPVHISRRGVDESLPDRELSEYPLVWFIVWRKAAAHIRPLLLPSRAASCLERVVLATTLLRDDTTRKRGLCGPAGLYGCIVRNVSCGAADARRFRRLIVE